MTTTKERISRIAQRIVVADGVDGVSMRRIAGEAGVSATAIYRHYDGKDDLLDEITAAGFATFAAYLEQAQDAPTARARLEGMMERYLDFAIEQPQHYDFMFIVQRRNVRKYADALARGASDTFNSLADEVEASMQEGWLATGDPTELALTIWAHLHGLVSLQRAGRFEGDAEGFRSLYRRSIRHLLTGIEAETRPDPSAPS